MVSVERQKAAKRAHHAYTAEMIFSIVSNTAGWGAYISAAFGNFPFGIIEGFLLQGVDTLFYRRAQVNLQRETNLLDSTIQDNDPRAQLRRNYRREAAAGAKAVAQLPRDVVNHFRTSK